jgi:uncharacterized membrane protein YeaQ/YmgE (transglycosylase-associated protein family)
MRIAASSFATDGRIRQQASVAFANGEALILEGGAPHDEKAISYFLSSPDFQKDMDQGSIVAAGAVVGGTIGVAAGAVVDQLIQTHPAAGILGKLLLGILGSALGGIVAQEASAAALEIPAGKAVAGRKVLGTAPAVEIAYDPQADHLIAQLKQQSIK